jgi:RNA polymerase subunit RPABC4/transcription elongation factor Spt4
MPGVLVSCPTCRRNLEMRPGEKTACPACGQRLQAPAPVAHTVLAAPAEPPPPVAPMAILVPVPPPPPEWPTCPKCGAREKPQTWRGPGRTGWMMVICSIFFPPLLWFGLFTREKWKCCRVCGHKMTFEKTEVGF